MIRVALDDSQEQPEIRQGYIYRELSSFEPRQPYRSEKKDDVCHQQGRKKVFSNLQCAKRIDERQVQQNELDKDMQQACIPIWQPTEGIMADGVNQRRITGGAVPRIIGFGCISRGG